MIEDYEKQDQEVRQKIRKATKKLAEIIVKKKRFERELEEQQHKISKLTQRLAIVTSKLNGFEPSLPYEPHKQKPKKYK